MNIFRNLILGIVLVSNIATFTNDDNDTARNDEAMSKEVADQEAMGGDVTDQKEEASEEASNENVVEADNQSKVEQSNKVVTEEQNKVKGLFSRAGNGLISLGYLPVNIVDWVAEKAFVNNLITKITALSFLKNKGGAWITKHNKGISRVVVVTVVGSAGYCAWKKYRESKEENRFRHDDDDGLFVFEGGIEMQDQSIDENSQEDQD